MADLADTYVRAMNAVGALADYAANRFVSLQHNRDRWRWLARAYRRRAKEAREAERERVLAILRRHEVTERQMSQQSNIMSPTHDTQHMLLCRLIEELRHD